MAQAGGNTLPVTETGGPNTPRQPPNIRMRAAAWLVARGNKGKGHGMRDEDFMDWVLEQRLNMLSEREGLVEEGEAIREIGDILRHGIEPEERTRLGFLLDRVRWGEKELYMKGVEDGIKAAKLICGI